MRVAISVWNGRISPLFDASRHLLICVTQGYGHPLEIVSEIKSDSESVEDKILSMTTLEIDALVCGAISRELEERVLSMDIEIDAFVAGSIDDVLKAWSDGSLRNREFSMPGCPCPRHRQRGRGYRRQRGGNAHRRRRW